MGKKRQPRKIRRTSKGKASSPAHAPSLAIPIAVGLVVVTVIAGAVLLRETGTSLSSGEHPAPASTAGPLPTGSIPYPGVERISVDEAKAQLDGGLAVLVDVRSRDSYNKNHAASAVSIPETEVEAHLDDLARDKALILY